MSQLRQELATATFNVEELINILDGGKDFTEKKVRAACSPLYTALLP